MTEELDVFSEPEETVFLTADNADEMLAQFAKPYTFPAEPGRPKEGFMVRMAQIGALQRWIRSTSQKNSDTEQFNALCHLIADSIVDHRTLEPIWTKESIHSIAKTNAPRFNRMTEAVLDRNDLKKMKSMIEDEEKN
jgi:hypothetical protein